MKKYIIFLFSFLCIFGNQLHADIPSAESTEINSDGMEYLEAGNLEKAEECFRRAIVINSAEKKYYNNLAVTFMRRKNFAEAHKYLEKAITLDDKYAKALGNMAIACFYIGSYMDAYKYYLRAEEADKSYTTSRFEKQKALTRIEELSKENPDNRDYKQMLEILKESGTSDTSVVFKRP